MTLEHIAYPRREPELVGEDVRLRNWARNATLGVPGSVCAPSTEAELQAALLAGSGQVRMIGSRMSPGRLTEVTEEGGILLDLSDVGASSSSLRREAHWQGPSHRAAGSPSGGSFVVKSVSRSSARL